MSGLLFHILADRIGLRRRGFRLLPDVEKIQYFASITTDIRQMTDLSLLRVRPQRDFDKTEMSLRPRRGL
jgi:hypothetical protein